MTQYTLLKINNFYKLAELTLFCVPKSLILSYHPASAIVWAGFHWRPKAYWLPRANNFEQMQEIQIKPPPYVSQTIKVAANQKNSEVQIERRDMPPFEAPSLVFDSRSHRQNGKRSIRAVLWPAPISLFVLPQTWSAAVPRFKSFGAASRCVPQNWLGVVATFEKSGDSERSLSRADQSSRGGNKTRNFSPLKCLQHQILDRKQAFSSPFIFKGQNDDSIFYLEKKERKRKRRLKLCEWEFLGYFVV